MSIPEFLDHLLGFVAPALAVALLVTAGARLVLPRKPATLSWWLMAAMNFLAGVVALAAGLWYFGRDGKMVTYVALVLTVATCQWVLARAWRS
ncbi:MAG: hypothetical protein JWP41_3285 [Ramlibacter sp.]|nr:hypothetical protein [Ramlibacter sp.]